SFFFFLSTIPQPPSSTLFPYTTLFRSGYRVSGTKHYATNASLAEWLWIGRVASDSHAKPIMFMMHRDTPGLKIDTEVWRPTGMRSEEHTSELQSRGHLVCRLLLEKKKK